MSQSLVQIYVHVVFSTKERRPYINDKVVREQLHAYLVGICNNQDCPAIRVGGVEDHVHLLVRLGKVIDISTLIRELKRESSKWLKTQSASMRDFHWQNGYGAFSVSPTHVEPVKEYIKNQESHHQRVSFEDELRHLCKRNGVAIDERYVWD